MPSFSAKTAFLFVYLLKKSYICTQMRAAKRKKQQLQWIARTKTSSIKNSGAMYFCGGVQVSIEWIVFVKLSHVGSDVTNSITSLSLVKLPEKQTAILELIRKDSRISVKEMSLVLSQVERTIKHHLADLQKKGVLIREGNTSAGHWEIIEK